jgi:hypothetical protein
MYKPRALPAPALEPHAALAAMHTGLPRCGRPERSSAAETAAARALRSCSTPPRGWMPCRHRRRRRHWSSQHQASQRPPWPSPVAARASCCHRRPQSRRAAFRRRHLQLRRHRPSARIALASTQTHPRCWWRWSRSPKSRAPSKTPPPRGCGVPPTATARLPCACQASRTRSKHGPARAFALAGALWRGRRRSAGAKACLQGRLLLPSLPPPPRPRSEPHPASAATCSNSSSSEPPMPWRRNSDGGRRGAGERGGRPAARPCERPPGMRRRSAGGRAAQEAAVPPPAAP